MGILTEFVNAELGKYVIEERIGTGGMATVFKGHQLQLGRSVAIKVLHEHLIHEDKFKERFEQEARFVASMNHPNIVAIYDYDVAEIQGKAIYYMVMPYIPGPTLADLMDAYRKQGLTLPMGRILQIVRDLCAALAYAHELGMIHRDIKPSNVLFDARNRAILTDFGIARLAVGSGLTQEGLIMGTPAYMSPEQANGSPSDHRSDLYALGCILFEMVTGRLPYHDDGSISVLVKHINSPVPTITDFLATPEPALDSVFASMLAKNAEDRFQSAGELLQAVEAATRKSELEQTRVISPGSRPNGTKPSTTSTRVLRTLTTTIIQPIRQNPLAIVAIALAVTALLVVARISQDTTAQNTAADIVTADSMTGAFFFESNFEDTDELNSFWQLVNLPDIQSSISAGSLNIQNRRASTARIILFEPNYVYEQMGISMEALLLEESASTSGYGIVFAYRDSDNYHVFAVDGQGRYSIWARETGVWRELRNQDNAWSQSMAVQTIGEANRLDLLVYDEKIIGYVNNVAVLNLNLLDKISGSVGIYLASPNQGEALLQVDGYRVGEAVPVAESMTFDP